VFLNIYMRRAVREYKKDGVPDGIIKDLIRAATYAPSAMNEQPWRFVVIKNREKIKKYSDMAKRLWLENAKSAETPESHELREMVSDKDFNIFYDAPVLILLFSAPDAMTPEYDCALAAGNMMLAAKSLGIGSCWIGLGTYLGTDKEFLKEIGVPRFYRLMAPLIFGYPVEDEQKAPQRKEDVILNWIT
jgi:nitroreductase